MINTKQRKTQVDSLNDFYVIDRNYDEESELLYRKDNNYR